MLDYGMELLEPDNDIDKEFEVSYRKENSTFHIELYKSLFAPDSEAYGELNKYFKNVHTFAVEQEIELSKGRKDGVYVYADLENPIIYDVNDCRIHKVTLIDEGKK